MIFRRIIIYTLISASSLLLLWILSPANIIPPVDPIKPVTVYVTDRGLHSRLILPVEDGKFIEYAYGDWNYFALNKQSISYGLAALFTKTQAALGRQIFKNQSQIQGLVKQDNINLLSFEVAQSKALSLGKSLEQRFQRNIDTQVKNPSTGLTLVQDEREYTLFHNSNHELVSWLEDLECQVTGFVMWSNFRVYDT
ncbi:MAG: DUF2459 domain-containing protein [Calothrix sp. C42_A2020_038]|nr:DUF2459 domain-containing protein [Calothrix sp. C42_A2020_038]